MNKVYRVVLLSMLLGAAFFRPAQAEDITGFTLRVSPGEGERIELVTMDGEAVSGIQGRHPFSVNGFRSDLEFRKGVAGLPGELSSSTFLYIKYEGEERNISRLFYVYRGFAGDYSVVPVPLALLIIVPLAFVLLGVFFRRLILLALLLLGAFFYFSNYRGLSPGDFFDAAREWLRGLF